MSLLQATTTARPATAAACTPVRALMGRPGRPAVAAAAAAAAARATAAAARLQSRQARRTICASATTAEAETFQYQAEVCAS